MAPMFEKLFRHDSRTYRVTVSFDDESMMNDVADFYVEGAFREDSWHENEWSRVTLKVTLDPQEEVVRIWHEGELIREIPLNLPIPDVQGPPSEAEAEDILLERLIEGIPVPDPLLGCLLRGAASTLVGQLIRCWRPVRQVDGARAKLRSLWNCMRTHGIRMSYTFMRRVIKCAIALGIF